jgi:hypothetical protein
VRLRCRNCSAVVTEPMRQAYMLPSPGWRELAEEWFCGACCGNGQDTGEVRVIPATSAPRTPHSP